MAFYDLQSLTDCTDDGDDQACGDGAADGTGHADGSGHDT